MVFLLNQGCYLLTGWNYPRPSSCKLDPPPRYSLNWRCFASKPCRLHQLFLRPAHYCCLKHLAVYFNLQQHPHYSTHTAASTLAPVLCLRGCSRALPRNGRHLLMALMPAKEGGNYVNLCSTVFPLPCRVQSLATRFVLPSSGQSVCLITDHTLFEDCVPSGGRSIVQRWTNSQDGCTPHQPTNQTSNPAILCPISPPPIYVCVWNIHVGAQCPEGTKTQHT